MTEKKPAKKSVVEYVKTWWSQIALLITIITTIVTGYRWVDERFDEYEQRGVDIGDLKETTNSLRGEQSAINNRITTSLNEGRQQIAQEFEERDAVDEELRAYITAVRNEMRARHGVVTLAESGTRRRVSVREAESQADEASRTAAQARPSGTPLEGLDDL